MVQSKQPLDQPRGTRRETTRGKLTMPVRSRSAALKTETGRQRHLARANWRSPGDPEGVPRQSAGGHHDRRHRPLVARGTGERVGTATSLQPRERMFATLAAAWDRRRGPARARPSTRSGCLVEYSARRAHGHRRRVAHVDVPHWVSLPSTVYSAGHPAVPVPQENWPRRALDVVDELLDECHLLGRARASPCQRRAGSVPSMAPACPMAMPYFHGRRRATDDPSIDDLFLRGRSTGAADAEHLDVAHSSLENLMIRTKPARAGRPRR